MHIAASSNIIRNPPLKGIYIFFNTIILPFSNRMPLHLAKKNDGKVSWREMKKVSWREFGNFLRGIVKFPGGN